jgi:hypothetical protein
VAQANTPPVVASVNGNGAAPGERIQAQQRNNSVVPGENNSVVFAKKVQSFSSVNGRKTTEFPRNKTTEKRDDGDDDWRFEIKRKRRSAGRKNSGSTAKDDWYYWVIRIRKRDGATLYYGTLDILDARDPHRLAKYWQRSRKRKVSKNAQTNRG